jgi:predicted dehydrogenase
MKNVLIYGAGSIGNHLSQAARRIGFSVTVVDNSSQALRRMKQEIYPTRYGKWDSEIKLLHIGDADFKRGEFDIIMIGTPPDSHMDLALAALALEPKILHVEKPLLRPTDDFKVFEERVAEHPSTMVTVGYDHAIAPSFQALLDYIASQEFGEVITIDASTREHWEGIFKAHPWLKGPHDSYLGYTNRGGGAACEHSHALHLALVVAENAGWRSVQGTCTLDMVNGSNGESYDRLALFSLKSSTGRIGRVVQDVLTKPTEKSVRVQCDDAVITWRCETGADVVEVQAYTGETITRKFSKTRPDDFFYLMKHYESLLDGTHAYEYSPIRVEMGLDAMKIIATGL